MVGAGPAYTDRPGATGAAYLVRSGGTSVLLDLGHGAFSQLVGRIDPGTLDAVLISHLHPDHFVDLVPLRHFLRWEDPRRRVRVIAPAGLDVRLDALHGEPGFCAAALDIEPLVAGSMTIGTLAVEVAAVTHTQSSFGFRVATGALDAPGLVYSGDCGRAQDLEVLIRSGDTLLSEVSFGPGPVDPAALHLDGPAVGDLARRSGAGRVLLTHIQMGHDRTATLDSVRARFDGPVEFVDPGFETLITG